MCVSAHCENATVLHLRQAIQFCSKERNCTEMGLEAHISRECNTDCAQKAVAQLEELGLITFTMSGEIGFTVKAKHFLNRDMQRQPEIFECDEIVLAMNRLFD